MIHSRGSSSDDDLDDCRPNEHDVDEEDPLPRLVGESSDDDLDDGRPNEYDTDEERSTIGMGTRLASAEVKLRVFLEPSTCTGTRLLGHWLLGVVAAVLIPLPTKFVAMQISMKPIVGGISQWSM